MTETPETASDTPEVAPESHPETPAPDNRYDRLRAALNAGYTGGDAEWIAERLIGDTHDELVADAHAVAEMFPDSARTMATDPSQGRHSEPERKIESLGETLRRMAGNHGGGKVYSA